MRRGIFHLMVRRCAIIPCVSSKTWYNVEKNTQNIGTFNYMGIEIFIKKCDNFYVKRSEIYRKNKFIF